MLRVTLVDIVEGCDVDVDALLLYHFGGSGAGVWVWTLAVDRGKTGLQCGEQLESFIAAKGYK
jgi:hypothetical protein